MYDWFYENIVSKPFGEQYCALNGLLAAFVIDFIAFLIFRILGVL